MSSQFGRRQVFTIRYWSHQSINCPNFCRNQEETAFPCSFGLGFAPPEDKNLDIDLSCVMYSKEGAVIDCAYHCNYSALDGAVRHNGDNQSGSKSGDAEVIHMYPGLVAEECCLMMLFVSGEQLNECTSLELTTYAKEAKKPKVCDASCFIRGIPINIWNQMISTL